MEALLITARLRWSGRIAHMSDTRLPKQVLYSELAFGARSRGGQLMQYKDSLKSSLKAVGVNLKHFEVLAANRSSWRALCKTAVTNFGSNRTDMAREKRAR